MIGSNKSAKLGIIFDRDGTLIHFVNYLSDYKKVKIYNDAQYVLDYLNNKGAYIFMHTNQSAVSRGIASIEDVKKCNDELIKQIKLGPNIFKEICISTELPSDKIESRKPSPKFGKYIMKKYNLSRDNLYYIGDNVCDLETAHNLGCNGIGIESGSKNFSNIDQNHKLSIFPICSSLKEALILIKQ